MSIHTFDYAQFIALFPAYSNATLYPQATLQAFWNSAINYIDDNKTCSPLNDAQRQYAINLMTAHLVYISGLIAAGTVPYLMQNATIDKVTVGLTPPPLKNQYSWWLSVSPYGQQLLSLLQVNSAGGFYVGGTPTLSGFRRGFGFPRGCC